MNHPRRRLLLATLLAVWLALPAADIRAEAPPAQRLAVVDMEGAIRGSQAGKRLLADLDTLVKRKQEEMRAAQNEARAIRAKAVDQASKASQKQLADLQRQYDEKMADLRRLQDEANQEVNKKRLEMLSEFNKRVMPVIEALGREQGYAMIFRKGESGLLYVEGQYDLTRQVVERLDAAK